jgi:flagellar M-ring protein FliF
MPPEPEPEEPEHRNRTGRMKKSPADRREAEEQKQVIVYKSNLEMAKTLAQNDPRIVANVIKEWLGAE